MMMISITQAIMLEEGTQIVIQEREEEGLSAVEEEIAIDHLKITVSNQHSNSLLDPLEVAEIICSTSMIPMRT